MNLQSTTDKVSSSERVSLRCSSGASRIGSVIGANTQPEEGMETRMKMKLSWVIAAVFLGVALLTEGCAQDPYAVGPDMSEGGPATGTPASGTSTR
jgi:hypothetical protein